MKRDYTVCDQCFSKHRATVGNCTLTDCTGTLRAPELLSAASEMLEALNAVIARLDKGQDINTETRAMVEEAIKHASD